MDKMRLVDANGRYTLHASDNTDYSLLFKNGIICVENELGHCVCEFFADDVPTVDAVEVVRCKDCKKWDEIKHGYGWCCLDKTQHKLAKEEEFCSHGERREGE